MWTSGLGLRARFRLLLLVPMTRGHRGYGAIRIRREEVRPPLAERQDQDVRRVLAETGGDRAAAARLLGISVRTLPRWARTGSG